MAKQTSSQVSNYHLIKGQGAQHLPPRLDRVEVGGEDRLEDGVAAGVGQRLEQDIERQVRGEVVKEIGGMGYSGKAPGWEEHSLASVYVAPPEPDCPPDTASGSSRAKQGKLVGRRWGRPRSVAVATAADPRLFSFRIIPIQRVSETAVFATGRECAERRARWALVRQTLAPPDAPTAWTAGRGAPILGGARRQ